MKLKFLILMSLACLLIVSANAQNVDISKVPTVDTTGKAEIQVVPDTATLSFAIVKKDKSVAVAKKQNDETVAKVTDLARRFNIIATDVKTDYIRVSEVSKRVKIKDSNADYEDVFDGYRVTRNMIIKLSDISKFETFLTALLDAGVNNVANVVFSSSELRKYKDQARAMAIRAAREKAEALAKEIGQTIGKAVSIDEENVDENRSSNSLSSNNNFSFELVDSYNAQTISVGTISVRAEVSARFLLY
jgi:uncharacterized protein